MSSFEYKCPRCNRVHVAISLEDADNIASKRGEPDDIAALFRCFSCGAPSSTFVQAGPDDRIELGNIAVVVIPGVVH